MRLSMRVWDLPVRLFHAAVILLLVAGVVTGRAHHWPLHARLGEALLALLVWRMAWGVMGSETARWRYFLAPPRVPRGVDDSFGHAAAGGWLIPALLAVLTVLVVSGLAGAAGLHRVAFWLAMGVIVAHVGLLLAGRTGESPSRAMLSGKKRLPAATRAPRMAGLGLAVLVLGCAAGGVLALLNAIGR